MVYLREFQLPTEEQEARFLAGSRENKRTCYGSRDPFGVFLSRTVPPLKLGEVTILCGGTGSGCLLYTSPSPRDGLLSRMPSSA